MIDQTPMRPQRVQQRRTKGWRKPDGVMSVARGTDWGNPFRVGDVLDVSVPPQIILMTITRPLAVALYREYVVQQYGPGIVEQLRRELGGRTLMCWCPLDQPCHADVLLELANP